MFSLFWKTTSAPNSQPVPRDCALAPADIRPAAPAHIHIVRNFIASPPVLNLLIAGRNRKHHRRRHAWRRRCACEPFETVASRGAASGAGEGGKHLATRSETIDGHNGIRLAIYH